MLKTRFSEQFGLRYPVISAPMANHSGGVLAGAVSAAGGLGTFGGINPGGPDWIREQVRLVRDRTNAIFGVGFITAFLGEPSFQLCLEERVPLLVFSFGDPSVWVKRAQAAGLRTISQVQTLEGVRQAADLRVDAIVVQGNEAGGHSGYMMTLPLLAMAVDLAGDVPVLAAGGIGNGRALAAVLAAGAEGALLGTPFLATPECHEVPQFHKDLIVSSDGQDTLHTRVYDILAGAPWPPGIGERVRRNAFVSDWADREQELSAQRDEVLPSLREGQERADPEVRAVLYGQSAGMVPSVRPAAEVMAYICAEAERLLRERPGQVLR